MLFSLHRSSDGSLPKLTRVQVFVLAAFFAGSLAILGIGMASEDLFLTWTAIAVGATCALSYVFGRRGHTDEALATVLCVVAGCVLTACYLFRGINDVGASLIPVLILMAGLLLNRRFVFSYAAVVMSGVVAVMAGRWWVIRIQPFNPSEARDLFLFILVCALSAAITERLTAHIGRSYGLIEASEKRFDQLAEQGRTAIWETDAQGFLTYMSRVSEVVWGYGPEEVVGRMYLCDLHSIEGREAFKRTISAVREKKETLHDLVHPTRAKDGRIVWVSTNGIPLLNDDGTLRGYRGSCTDITERMHANEVLRKSEELHRILLQTAMDGFSLADALGNLIEVNDAYCRMTGYSAQELMAMRITDLEAQETAAATAVHLRTIMAKGEDRFESRHRRKDGSLFDVEVSVKYQATDGGRLVVFLRDITEQKREERQQSLRTEILAILNQPPAGDTLSRVLDSVKRETGADSVGIRILDDLDLPYYVQQGLSGDFPITGNASTAHAARRPIRRDRDGGMRLECSCGAVLSEKADPEGPFFTAFGSCWTNNSVQLLDLPEDQDPSNRPQTRCIHEGLGSMALIPIRANQEALGLLQLNYFREGTLTIRDVQFFEEVCSMIGVSLKRKQAEESLLLANESLARAERHYRGIFERASAGIFRTSPEGKTLAANSAVAKILGYDSSEEVTAKLEDFANQVWGDPNERSRFFELLAKDGVVRAHECQFKRKDGSAVWVAITCRSVKGADGEVLYNEGFIDDITERKLALDALRESEERFRSIADTCPVIIWYGDTAQQVTFLNRQAAVFSGRDLNELMGGGWHELVHAEDRVRLNLTLSTAVANQSGFQTEHRLRRHDGEYRWVLSTGVPRYFAGVYAGYTGIAVDITDVKRKQEQVLAAQKLESLGVLAGGIAHDFNNMLGSILTESELVLSELPPGAAAAQEVEKIKMVAVRTAEIVGQLLAYAGQEGASFEPVDLSRLVEEMLQLMKASISKGAELNTGLDGDLPAVMANASQMRQVVMNLITNASESLGSEGGAITVSTSRYRNETSRGENGDGSVILEVSDTGCGMSEEVQARMFDPFFSTKFAGRGLGLAAVQGIVRSHGGTINVVSSSGEGTRIRVQLPCDGTRAAAESTAAVIFAEKAGAARETVLFVEDEETLRTPTSKMLRKMGFSIHEAGEGLSAVELFRIHGSEIEVVLLDLTLPGMSGKDVFTELRRIRPGVKVILTTAYSEDVAVDSLGGPRDWAFIRKPYSVHALAKLIRDVRSG